MVFIMGMRSTRTSTRLHGENGGENGGVGRPAAAAPALAPVPEEEELPEPMVSETGPLDTVEDTLEEATGDSLLAREILELPGEV